jgi:hypothetical protein
MYFGYVGYSVTNKNLTLTLGTGKNWSLHVEMQVSNEKERVCGIAVV